MRLDALNRFSDAQAVTAAAASTSQIDLGPGTSRNIGVGKPLYIVVCVDTAFTDSGSDSTLAVALQTSSDNASSDAYASVQTIGTFAALSAAGTRLVAMIQPDAVLERYIQLYYTPASGNLTAGAVTAFLTDNIDAFTAYPDNQTITG